MSFDWNQPGRIEELKAMYSEGLSAGQIAAAINHMFRSSITRNAVIGKALRLGLVNQNKQGRSANPINRKSPRPRSALKPKSHQHAFIPPPEQLPEPQATDLPADQSDCAVTLEQLAAHHCRWPIGNDIAAMTYCGARKHGDRVYCARHCRAAYINRGARAA